MRWRGNNDKLCMYIIPRSIDKIQLNVNNKIFTELIKHQNIWLSSASSFFEFIQTSWVEYSWPVWIIERKSVGSSAPPHPPPPPPPPYPLRPLPVHIIQEEDEFCIKLPETGLFQVRLPETGSSFINWQTIQYNNTALHSIIQPEKRISTAYYSQRTDFHFILQYIAWERISTWHYSQRTDFHFILQYIARERISTSHCSQRTDFHFIQYFS